MKKTTKMNKYMKIGIALLILGISSIATAAIVMNSVKPLEIIHTESTFDGVDMKVDTDKNAYDVGEEVTIGVSLTNANSKRTTLFCNGYRDTETGELYTLFHVAIYDAAYTRIWYYTIPGKYEMCKYSTNLNEKTEENISTNGSLNSVKKYRIGNITEDIKPIDKYMKLKYEACSFIIDLNASSTRFFESVITWNQTAKNIFASYVVGNQCLIYEHNKQVPAGEYIISVTVPLDMPHYFGSVFKDYYFGASATIIIE